MGEPFIRTMPHAEHPSGSMAICRAIADFTKRWVQDASLFAPGKGMTDLATDWSCPAGAAAALGAFAKDGTALPREAWEGRMDTLDMLAQVCGESRLWGGMHFSKSVKAAEKLVAKFGKKTFAKEISNGDSIPNGPLTVDPNRLAPGEYDECVMKDTVWAHKGKKIDVMSIEKCAEACMTGKLEF